MKQDRLIVREVATHEQHGDHVGKGCSQAGLVTAYAMIMDKTLPYSWCCFFTVSNVLHLVKQLMHSDLQKLRLNCTVNNSDCFSKYEAIGAKGQYVSSQTGWAVEKLCPALWQSKRQSLSQMHKMMLRRHTWILLGLQVLFASSSERC